MRIINLSIIILLFFTSLIVYQGFTDINIAPKIFYFQLIIIILLIIQTLEGLLGKNRYQIKINILDISILLFSLYFIIRSIYSYKEVLTGLNFITLCSLILLYFLLVKEFRFYNNNKKFTNILIFSIYLVILIQVFTGLLQYFEILKSYNPYYKTIGYFDNPGRYGIYLSSFLPFAFGLALCFRKSGNFIFISSIVVCVCILIILPFTSSRAAWIATIISFAWLIYNTSKIKTYILNILNTKIKKILALIILVILCLIFCFALFNFKSESAKGRVFIWSNCIRAISEKPIFGWGFDSYIVTINNQQIKYFSKNKQLNEYTNIADDNKYAFNEFLKIGVEMGLLGLAFFLFVILATFRNKEEYHNAENEVIYSLKLPAKAGIISILISSLFAYPLSDVPVQIFFVFYLAIISVPLKTTFTLKKIPLIISKSISFVSIIVLLFLAFIFFIRFTSERLWNYSAQALILQHKVDKQFIIYKTLYTTLKYNPYFLYNYGAELSQYKYYQQSIPILEETAKRLTNCDLYIFLGKSYKGLGNYDKAEENFYRATYLAPKLFYPKCCLVALYDRIGRKKEALAMAYKIDSMEIKVPSPDIYKMKSAIKKYIHDNSNQE